MKKIFIYFFLLTCNIYGQKIDKQVANVDSWTIPSNLGFQQMNSFGVNVEKPINMSLFYENDPKVYKAMDFESFPKYYDKPAFWLSGYKSLLFNFRQYYEDSLSDFTINIKIVKSYISIETKKREERGSVAYEGIIRGVNVVKMDFVDKNGKILNSLSDKSEKELRNIAVSNNYPITTKELALKLAKEDYDKNSMDYYKGNFDELTSLLSSISYKVKNDIDIYLVKEPYTFYTIKDNDLDFSMVNKNVKNIVDNSNREYHPHDYYQQINESAQKSIEEWKVELTKYKTDNKKEMKMVWAILYDITSAYLILGDYANATSYVSQMKGLNYEKKETSYLEEKILYLKEKGFKDGVSSLITKKDFDKVNREKISSITDLAKELVLKFYLNDMISQYNNNVMPTIYFYNSSLQNQDKIKNITEEIKTKEQTIQVKYIYDNNKLTEVDYNEGQNSYKNMLGYENKSYSLKYAPIFIDLKGYQSKLSRKIEIDYNNKYEWEILFTAFDPLFPDIKTRYIYDRKNNSIKVYYMHKYVLSNGTITYLIDKKTVIDEYKLDTFRRTITNYGKGRYGVYNIVYNNDGLIHSNSYNTSEAHKELIYEYKYDNKGNWIEKEAQMGSETVFKANRIIGY